MHKSLESGQSNSSATELLSRNGVQIALVSVLSFFGILSLVFFCFPPDDSNFKQFGENDFLQYWSAFTLHLRGVDPFDPKLMFAVERARGWQELRPLLMWNPPWLLSLLTPVLIHKFDVASRAFLSVNIFLLLASGFVCLSAMGRKLSQSYPALLAGLCFFPSYLSLELGQVGVLMTFATSVLYLAVVKEKPYLIGVVLAIVTIKLQLLYLIYIVLLFVIPLEQYKKIATSFCIALAVLIGILFLESPNTFSFWLNRSQHSESPLLVSFLSWKTTTLSTIARDYLFRSTGVLYTWPMFVVPLGTAALFLTYSLKARKLNAVDWIPLLLPLTCFTSPFSWIYDASVCMITQIWLFTVLLPLKGSRTALSLMSLAILVQLWMFYLRFSSQPDFDAYWLFYPFVIVLSFSAVILRNKVSSTVP